MSEESLLKSPFPDDSGKADEVHSETPKGSIQASQLADLKRDSRKRKLRKVEKLAPSKAGVFVRAYKGISMRAAINANCLECQGYESGEVRECQILDCPMWEFRPYQKVKK